LVAVADGRKKGNQVVLLQIVFRDDPSKRCWLGWVWSAPKCGLKRDVSSFQACQGNSREERDDFELLLQVANDLHSPKDHPDGFNSLKLSIWMLVVEGEDPDFRRF
jgi:hypothetical protein